MQIAHFTALDTILHYTLLGNDILHLLSFLASLIVVYIASCALSKVLKKAAQSLQSSHKVLLSITCLATARSTKLLGLCLGLKLGIPFLSLNPSIAHFLDTSFHLLLWIGFTYWFFNLVEVPTTLLSHFSAQKKHSTVGQMLIPSVRRILQTLVIIVFGVHIFQIISNQPISSLIAGLGIGGLAVAMAAKETIGNFFGSLVIFSDKPFELGEKVRIDSFEGIVEDVGMRSTRLRTLAGTIVTIPNADLANKIIENLSRSENIRRIINIGLHYTLPNEKIEEALTILRNLMENHEGQSPMLPPRVFIAEFGDYYIKVSLNFWYHPNDIPLCNQFTEKVLLMIHKKLQEANITIAHLPF